MKAREKADGGAMLIEDIEVTSCNNCPFPEIVHADRNEAEYRSKLKEQALGKLSQLEKEVLGL